MSEDKGKEEEKFDFTPEGEGYISLDEARVLAMRTASATPGDFGRNFRRVTMVFEVVESTETEDHYTVVLSVRPQGDFLGRPGQEQFVIGKEGTIALRQVLSSPIQTSATPPGTARNGGRFPLLPVAIGLVVVGAIAAVGAVIVLMGSGGDSVPIAVAPPTETPAPIEPTVNIKKVEAAVQQRLAASATAAPPMPTFTPMPSSRFNPSTYTLTVKSDYGGTVTGGGTYPPGETATITATPDQGYSFSGWSGTAGRDCSGGGACSITMNSNKTVTADFSHQQYTFKKKDRGIVFAGLNRDSALVQNGVARYIVEHGYGYPTSEKLGTASPLFQGLRKGDLDVAMDIWLPNFEVVWHEAIEAGEVIPAGKSPEFMIALNTELLEDAFELVTFFKKWDWDAENRLPAEAWYIDNKEALANEGKTSEEIYRVTGVWYLKNNDAWKSWVSDDVVENVLDAIAATSHLEKGHEYLNTGRWGFAVEEYTKAIQLNPDYLLAYESRASTHGTLGQLELAIQDYDVVIQLDPDDACNYHSRGLFYARLPNPQSAIRDYDKALRLDPDNALIYRTRGYSYSYLGQHGNAEADWVRSDEISGSAPSSTTTYLNADLSISHTVPRYTDGVKC